MTSQGEFDSPDGGMPMMTGNGDAMDRLEKVTYVENDEGGDGEADGDEDQMHQMDGEAMDDGQDDQEEMEMNEEDPGIADGAIDGDDENMQGAGINSDMGGGGQMDYEQMDLRICGDLIEKNKKLDEFFMSQNLDGQIKVRIEQLAVCKILVNIHRKELFILVQAYTQLGEAYLNNKYYEQALDHLTTALKLNGSLFQKHEQTKRYHSQILTLLGKCYMEAGNYKDALSLLEKSLKMNVEVLGGDHMSNAAIFIVVSNVYTKQKEYEKALQQLKHVEGIYLQYSQDPQLQVEQLANTYLEMAKVQSKAKNLQEAIIYQTKAFDSFSQLEKYTDTDYLAQIVMNLSELQDKANMTQEALESLRIVEKIYKNNYSEVHAKTCKVKRNISLLCLKSDQNFAALEELRQVEDLERTLYGETSTQLGKTYKVIGTIHLLNKNHLEAKDYLLKAQSIFEQRGQLKLLKEVKTKLKLLTPGKLNQMMSEGGLKAAQVLGVNSTGGMSGLQAVMDSDEDAMGEAIQMDQAPRRGKVGKKAKKKNSSVTGSSSNQAMVQRKVFNNFMGDK